MKKPLKELKMDALESAIRDAYNAECNEPGRGLNTDFYFDGDKYRADLLKAINDDSLSLEAFEKEQLHYGVY